MKIFGILYLNDKTTYVGKKGEKLKKFISLYDKKEYLVKTKRDTLHQTYCIIDTENNCVVEYLDDFKTNPELIPEKMGLLDWSFKWDNFYSKENNLSELAVKDYTDNRINFKGNIISVDPDGCEDIDDAISIEIKDDIEIAIHISDPTSYILKGTDLDKELFKRASSLYLDETHHMMPLKMATELISLKKNKKTRAYTCLIKFNTNKIEDVANIINSNKESISFHFEFIKTNIIVNENLSYDKFQTQIDDNKYYKDIYDIGKQILDGLGICYEEYDSHKMIEAYMVLCNMCASNKSILKRANLLKQEKFLKEDKYKQYNQTLALYTLEYKKHEGLDLYYTHFTSPIRRYADMIVHRLIFDNNTYTEDELIHIISHINDKTKYYKKIYNLYNLFKIVGDNIVVELSGTIIGIEYNQLKILSEQKILYMNLVSSKILNSVYIEYDDNKIKIINIGKLSDTNKEILYNRGDTVSLKIYYYDMNLNPFKIIVDDMTDLFI
jgi:exosome complex exonuclease DIS3/RRP44